jgi:L-alanine-DL-glutamate epimerase-like enolase superfamily enzyme
MKIVDLKAFPLSLPIKKGSLPIPVASKTVVVVKVFTDEGITGIGEPSAAFRTAPGVVSIIEHSLKPFLVGKDPLKVERLWNEMYRVTFYYGRKGIAICAISGIEQALWDIVGKARSIPVYQMLGGISQDKVKAYASLYRYDNTDHLASALSECLLKGYQAVKLHQDDALSVKLARQIVGDKIDLMVDVNAAWDPRKAIDMAKKFQEYGLTWLEEPVWPGDDYEGLSIVRAAVDTPIALGENEYTLLGFKEVVTKRAADIIQPCVSKIGISQAKKVLALTHSWNLLVSPHCFCLGPAFPATLHLTISDQQCLFMETPIAPLEAELFTEPLKPINGYWEIPDKPGWGVEIDEKTLSKYPYTGEDTIPMWCR